MEAQIFLSEEARATDPAVVGSQQWPDGLEATTGQKEAKQIKYWLPASELSYYNIARNVLIS